MKRWIALVLMLLMMGASSALAWSEYGTAVVNAPSGKLHLREQGSQYSASKGLYFTGTEVECLSSPWDEWTEVRIGYETGFMLSKYLKTGNTSGVRKSFQTGWVTAKNWGRMRMGPSTEYEFVCNVSEGRQVTIMGESVNHWYYIQAGTETGFMSGNLISLNGYTQGSSSSSSGSSSSSSSGSSGTSSAAGWKTAYRNWVNQNGSSSYSYALIDVNRDNIPELAVNTGVEAIGCRILTYGQGGMDVLQTQRCGFTYISKGNVLCNSDGNMDSYYDVVYTIENGRWKQVASGQYYGYKDGWSEEQGRYICQTYVFNGQQMSMESYLNALDRVYPRHVAVTPDFTYSHSQILRQLQ